MSSPVFFFDPEDEGMIQAVVAAQATFRYFWRELCWERRRILPGLDFAAIKLPFQDEPGSEVEHMWVGDVEFDGDTLSGTLMNEPNWLQSVRQNDRVTAPFVHLEDWMFAVGGIAYGGHTVQRSRENMSPDERAAHDDAWGLDFGFPGQVRLELHNPEPTSGHLDHPMCLNMLPRIEQQLRQNAAPYLEPDEQGWTMLHHEALAGNLGVTKLLIQYGGDVRTLTSQGRTPAELAAGIGWHELATELSVSAA
ncbi:MAG TPA: DUF2314 domain-containing protein [Prosthecobacter sp.]|nr:DUF2314 domain-containing protein [Prosthecobacter sp.]